MTDPLVRARDLHVQIGRPGRRTHAVRGIDLDLYPGECLAIVGESGSGKSVTLRSLIGLAAGHAQVRASELTVLGQDALTLTQRQWQRLRGRRIGMVLQDALVALDPVRTVGAEVGETIRRHRLAPVGEVGQRVTTLLRDAGIPDPAVRARQYPHELSGGLRQRALIASALSGQPSLLLADEPTSALDVTIQQQVLALLRSIKDSGVGILLVTHDLGAVARLADRVAVMRAGELVEVAATGPLLRTPTHPYTRALVAAVPRLRPAHPPPPAPAAVSAAAVSAAVLSAAAVSAAAAAGGAGPDRAVVELDQVTVTFPGPGGTLRRAVDTVNFTVHTGQSWGVVGESGSGKTTLARVILGLQRPDQGQVRLRHPDDGAVLLPGDPRRARTLQLIQQNTADALDPRWTVRAGLTEVIRRHDRTGARATQERALALLDAVGLDQIVLERRPHELSGGQRQRVTIARALAARPRILLCDEAVSALDTTVQAQVLDLLATLRARLGLTLLFISHDLGVVSRVCEHVVVMHDGAVVETGTIANVFAQPQHAYTRRLLDAVTAAPEVAA